MPSAGQVQDGVHRLVRISPFDSTRRHTSFASVNVYPVIDDRIIGHQGADVRTDDARKRSRGQHVSKTDRRSAHIPTNIVVFCQNTARSTESRAGLECGRASMRWN